MRDHGDQLDATPSGDDDRDDDDQHRDGHDQPGANWWRQHQAAQESGSLGPLDPLYSSLMRQQEVPGLDDGASGVLRGQPPKPPGYPPTPAQPEDRPAAVLPPLGAVLPPLPPETPPEFASADARTQRNWQQHSARAHAAHVARVEHDSFDYRYDYGPRAAAVVAPPTAHVVGYGSPPSQPLRFPSWPLGRRQSVQSGPAHASASVLDSLTPLARLAPDQARGIRYDLALRAEPYQLMDLVRQYELVPFIEPHLPTHLVARVYPVEDRGYLRDHCALSSAVFPPEETVETISRRMSYSRKQMLRLPDGRDVRGGLDSLVAWSPTLKLLYGSAWLRANHEHLLGALPDQYINDAIVSFFAGMPGPRRQSTPGIGLPRVPESAARWVPAYLTTLYRYLVMLLLDWRTLDVQTRLFLDIANAPPSPIDGGELYQAVADAWRTSKPHEEAWHGYVEHLAHANHVPAALVRMRLEAPPWAPGHRAEGYWRITEIRHAHVVSELLLAGCLELRHQRDALAYQWSCAPDDLVLWLHLPASLLPRLPYARTA